MGMHDSHYGKTAPLASGVFQKLVTPLVTARWWNQLEARRRAERGRGRKPELSIKELMGSLVYHGTMESGSLEQHVEEFTGKKLSGAALSQRRQALPWKLFEQIADHALRPLADIQKLSLIHI